MALFVLLGVLSPRRRLYEPEAADFRLRRTDERHLVPLCGDRKPLRDLDQNKKLLISELDTRCVHFKFMDGHYLTQESYMKMYESLSNFSTRTRFSCYFLGTVIKKGNTHDVLPLKQNCLYA